MNSGGLKFKASDDGLGLKILRGLRLRPGDGLGWFTRWGV